MTRTTKIASVVGGIAVVATLLFLASWRRSPVAPAPAAVAPPPTVDVGRLTNADLLLPQRSRGRDAAPLTIFEFSDFQCPFCRQFWNETLPSLEREYIRTGKARLIFINLPLPGIHPNAPAAHAFAMCAARQGNFWAIHDLLYRHQEQWAKLPDPSGYLLGLADSAALSRDAIKNCLDAGTLRWLVQADAEISRRAGAQSTPTFLIEGGLLAGAWPIKAWRHLLDSMYAAKTKKKGDG